MQLRAVNMGSPIIREFPTLCQFTAAADREARKRYSEEQRIAKVERYREKYGTSRICRRSQPQIEKEPATPVSDLQSVSTKSKTIQKRSKSTRGRKSKISDSEAVGISVEDPGNVGMQQDTDAKLPTQEQSVTMYVGTGYDTTRMEYEGVSFETLQQTKDQLAFDIGMFVLNNLLLTDSSGESAYKLFGFQYYEDLETSEVIIKAEPECYQHIKQEVLEESESSDELVVNTSEELNLNSFDETV